MRNAKWRMWWMEMFGVLREIKWNYWVFSVRCSCHFWHLAVRRRFCARCRSILNSMEFQFLYCAQFRSEIVDRMRGTNWMKQFPNKNVKISISHEIRFRFILFHQCSVLVSVGFRPTVIRTVKLILFADVIAAATVAAAVATAVAIHSTIFFDDWWLQPFVQFLCQCTRWSSLCSQFVCYFFFLLLLWHFAAQRHRIDWFAFSFVLLSLFSLGKLNLLLVRLVCQYAWRDKGVAQIT